MALTSEFNYYSALSELTSSFAQSVDYRKSIPSRWLICLSCSLAGHY